ncbi:MAG: hypothetical protein IJI14_06390 [Anaerolineaceae bacterium]|nr:hypothetical protein [Anaerolineaceae bacterium]
MQLAVSLILSFLAVRGFRFEFGAKVLVLRNMESFLWLILFLFFTVFFYKNLKDPNRRLKRYAAGFAVIIAFFHVVGGSLERMTGVAWIFQSKSMLVNFLNICFSFFCLYYCFACISFSILAKQSLQARKTAGINISIKPVLITWLILVICYLPWYFYFYPGILTEDSGAQIYDAITTDSLGDHNPAFVTLLIRAVIVPVMKLTGSLQIGVSVCTFLQMLILTFIFALTFIRICNYIKHPVLRGLFFIWFAFYPVNNIYSITMWKDILFSACLLTFSLCLDECTEDESAFFGSKRKKLLLFLTMLLLPLLRHNGIAVTIGMSIYFLFRFKAFRKTVIFLCLGVLFTFAAWKTVLLPVLHAGKNPSGELLNVPIQQISRVLSNHHGEVSPWLLEDIQAYFKKEQFWEDYWEKIADPIKIHFKNDVYDEDPGKFWSLWAQLGKKYPIEYLESFLQGNYGYWYPETSWWINGLGIRINMPLEGIRQDPVIRFKITDFIYNWYTLREYNKTPILPLFFKPGAMWWLWVFCAAYSLYNNRRKFILFLPGLLLWLTLLFSAVYCEFRYAYGLFVCLPLLLSAALTPQVNRSPNELPDDAAGK